MADPPRVRRWSIPPTGRDYPCGESRAVKERTTPVSAAISGQAAAKASSRSRCRSVTFFGRVSSSRVARRGERCGCSSRVPSLVQVPHEKVVAADEAQSADFTQQCGGLHARLLFTTGGEVVPVRVDHAGPVLGNPLDTLRGGGAG